MRKLKGKEVQNDHRSNELKEKTERSSSMVTDHGQGWSTNGTFALPFSISFNFLIDC